MSKKWISCNLKSCVRQRILQFIELLDLNSKFCLRRISGLARFLMNSAPQAGFGQIFGGFCMRTVIELRLPPGPVPTEDIKLDAKSRDDTPARPVGLQTDLQGRGAAGRGCSLFRTSTSQCADIPAISFGRIKSGFCVPCPSVRGRRHEFSFPHFGSGRGRRTRPSAEATPSRKPTTGPLNHDGPP